jgi:gas vesicle protein GvpL/GvpF
VADDLARWAGTRAPDLLARAEAEAVAVLRDALVRAAVGERRPEPAAPAAPAPDGELLWTYCVARAGDRTPDGVGGVAGGAVERIEADGLVAFVGRVPASAFAAEPLRRNLNDLPWLERVARTHEAVLDQAMRAATIVPLRMCTLYESQDGVRHMLEREHESFVAALDVLAGREEWGVKLLVDPDRLQGAASAERPAEDDRAERGEGGAYMLRRRHEREVREAAHAFAGDVARQVHARLQDWALDAVTLPAQNRELSGHEGEMLLNAAYLVEADRVAELRDLVSELERRHEDIGARIELTGPWPPYNFVSDRGG